MKRLITIILALSILLSVLAGITASALELDEDVIIDDSSYEEELMPLASGCPNDYNHIFGEPGHNLSGFLNSYNGNQAAAYNAVQGVAQSYVIANNITGVVNSSNQFTINVNGYNITVRGRVINGIFNIGTFFII